VSRADGSGRDWHAWHTGYDDQPALAARLRTVQQRIRDALDASPTGPVRVVSVCAGEARDLLGALDGHPRAPDVRGRLVELDATLAATARARLQAMGLPGIDVMVGDAGNMSAYAGAVPADLVLVCGVFGNITLADLANTVRSLPMLCAPGATVIWTRHRRPPDATPSIRAWCADAGLREVAIDAPDGYVYSVGTFRFEGEPQPFANDGRLFAFVGFDNAADS
jgi:hypothetical protein